MTLENVFESEVECLLGDVSHNVCEVAAPKRPETFFLSDTDEAVHHASVLEFGVGFHFRMRGLVL